MKNKKSAVSQQEHLYNNALKYFKLGKQYLKIRKIDQPPNINNQKALKFLRKSADLGYAPAQGKLGHMYEFFQIDDYEEPPKLTRFVQKDFDKRFDKRRKEN